MDELGRNQQAENFMRMREELRRLLRAGLIGTYDHLELLELIATPCGGRTMNVLSIIVLGEGEVKTDLADDPGERIYIDGFKNWSFGVARTFRPISALDAALADFAEKSIWALSGKPLVVGQLQPQPPAFAPPDGTVRVPMNRVLKNNFWAGAHVFRLLDPEKAQFEPFFKDRRRLQALSDAVSRRYPLALAGLPDLLGDVLIQLPVTVLVPAVRPPPRGEDLVVSVAWHPSAMPRPLRISARTRADELLTGAAVSERFDAATRLNVNGHLRPVEAEIWDDDANLLVAATASTSTIKRIELNLHIRRHEPRLFTAADAAGKPAAARVTLNEHGSHSRIGEEPTADADF